MSKNEGNLNTLASNGTAAAASRSQAYQDLLASMTAYEALWQAKSLKEKLGVVLGWTPRDWVKEQGLSVLAPAWEHPLLRADITLAWKEQAPLVSVQVLTDAIDYWRTQMGMDAVAEDGPPSSTLVRPLIH